MSDKGGRLQVCGPGGEGLRQATDALPGFNGAPDDIPAAAWAVGTLWRRCGPQPTVMAQRGSRPSCVAFQAHGAVLDSGGLLPG